MISYTIYYNIFARSISDEMIHLDEHRRKSSKRAVNTDTEGWDVINLKEEVYEDEGIHQGNGYIKAILP